MGYWESLTNDTQILSAVSGYRLDFITFPVQFKKPKPIPLSSVETENLNIQVENFLQKGIITQSHPEQGEFISNVFLREKKDGSYRMILNLKEMNQWVKYNHFKSN